MATQVRPRWDRRRQAGESHPYSTPRLCQLQDHNHQDDDHQHPDNDANYASVHFASVKFPWSATLPVRSCMSEPSEDCRVPWLDSSNAWIRAVNMVCLLWREEDRLLERSKNSGWPVLSLFVSSRVVVGLPRSSDADPYTGDLDSE